MFPRTAAASASATSSKACRGCRCPRTCAAPNLGAEALASWSSAHGAYTAACVDASVIHHVVTALTPPPTLDHTVIISSVPTSVVHVRGYRSRRPATHLPATSMLVVALTPLMVIGVPWSAVLPGLVLASGRPAAPPGAGERAPWGMRCSSLARLRTGRTCRLMEWPRMEVAMAISAPIMWEIVFAKSMNGVTMKLNASVVGALSSVRKWASSHVASPRVGVPTLGMLVHICLTASSSHLISPRPHIPTLALGTSCVAGVSIAGSRTGATHGVPVTPCAVGVYNDVSAVVGGGVGVVPKLVARSKSATSTPSCQLPSVDPLGGVVDAVAKAVTKKGSAAPTTSPSDPSPLALLLGCRWRLSSDGVVGNRVRERRPTSVPPGLLMTHPSGSPDLGFLRNASSFPAFFLVSPSAGILLVPPTFLILILLVPAPAEAADVVGTLRGRAGSLVPVVRAAGGSRRGLILSGGLGPSVMDGHPAKEHCGIADGAHAIQAAREDAVQVARGDSAMRHTPRIDMPTGGPASRMAGSATPRSPTGRRRWMMRGITKRTQGVEGSALATVSACTKSMMKEPSIPPAAAGGMLLNSASSSQTTAVMISTSGVKKVADATAMRVARGGARAKGRASTKTARSARPAGTARRVSVGCSVLTTGMLCTANGAIGTGTEHRVGPAVGCVVSITALAPLPPPWPFRPGRGLPRPTC